MDAVTRESRARIAGKYDQNLEDELKRWIEGKLGTSLRGEFMEGLRDGLVLCKLAGVNEREIKRPGPGLIAARKASQERENLEAFNQRCRDLGIMDHDLFVTRDLYEGANHTQVLQNLSALRKKLDGYTGKKGYTGKQHHVRTHSSNRIFDSKPAQVPQKGGSFGLRDRFEGKPAQNAAQTTPPPFNAGVSNNKPKFCTECGSKTSGARFCGECGIKLF